MFRSPDIAEGWGSLELRLDDLQLSGGLESPPLDISISLTIHRGHLDLSAKSPKKSLKLVPGASQPGGLKSQQRVEHEYPLKLFSCL